jgi:hypothetical protein
MPGNGFEGFMQNGKISVTVASNNLTVAVKTLADADPSASDPIKIRINGVVRTITAALSVTKNAGTNWCNAGGAELATKEIDYFVYLGYNATDGVTIGFSRIPYGNRYSDFSATTTNEKYCAISTITNAAAGDVYVNIGRFASILSAGAGYTWTVPTFTPTNLIQRPIFETRWLSNESTFGGFTATVPNGSFTYKVIMDMLTIVYIPISPGTSNATTFTFTMPFKSYATLPAYLTHVADNGANLPTPGHLQFTGGSNTCNVWKTFYQGVFTNSGTKDIYCTPFSLRIN